MNQYLLSTYAGEQGVEGAPASPDEMQTFMERVIALEAKMDEAGAFVFGGALDLINATSVARPGQGDLSPGPFAEADAHLAGFYIINAEDLQSAQVWGAKVAEATNHPIEVRPFRATGRVADQMG
jgi:hypothetical protein